MTWSAGSLAVLESGATTPTRMNQCAFQGMVVALATSVHNDRSVLHLIGWNTHVLQRRIVERSGRAGEHYVTSTRADYRQMWLAAAGGGLLTVGTAAVETAMSAWHVSDFMHGVLYGLNYAVSFLLLQRFHLVLATRQPASLCFCPFVIPGRRSPVHDRERGFQHVYTVEPIEQRHRLLRGPHGCDSCGWRVSWVVGSTTFVRITVFPWPSRSTRQVERWDAIGWRAGVRS